MAGTGVAASAEADLDRVLGALANGERRQIMRQLRRGPSTTPQIAKRFDFSKQALSRHLAILEDAGLIERRALGRVRDIALVPDRLSTVSNWIVELRRGWEASLDRLDALMEARK